MTSRPDRTSGACLTRRRFVSLSAAGTLMATGARATTGNPDVVIVGAGAAGIAAAHELGALGISYVHIEAASRVGGRAFTETDTFGVPFDHGPHWLQNQTRNPYFKRATDSGHRFYKAPDEYRVFEKTRPATDAEEADLWEQYEAVERAISTAGRAGQDVAPSTVAPSDSPWAKTAWFAIGPWEMGKDMDSFSCKDWWNSADSVDYYCEAGYGTLVAERAAGLPVRLNTPATTIRWGGQGVEVETPDGTIRARAVIVTVSTSVLAEEVITFEPALPVDKQDSFHAIEMGDYNHIALQFSKDIFGMGEDGYLFHQVPDSGEAFGALTNASGSGLTYCDVGGTFAQELEGAGAAAAIDFVQTTLRNLLGSDVDRYFQGGATTAWRSDPLVKGCYASAAPGMYDMRAVLRAPVAERVFFAGEACHLDMWATVGGADLSGRDTAGEVAKVLA